MRPVLLLLMVLAAGLCGQDKPKLPPWRIDPYTKNDPKALAAMGYVSFAPMPFGQRGSKVCTTEDIDKHLSYERILWVETPHFRIGTALPEWIVPVEPDTRAKLREEIGRLQKKLPKFEPKTMRLDPWLRLHLIAQRCEDIYAATQDLFGVKDSDFPIDKSKVIAGQGRYMGYGPFLGMAEKYLLLVFDKSGSYQDYLKNFVGRVTKYEQRWHFKESGSLIYVLPCDLDQYDLRHDTDLHTDIAHGLSHSLSDGFRHYSYDLPVWLTEGLAHWYSRRISARVMCFCQNESSAADFKRIEKWPVETRRYIASGKGATFSEAIGWRDFSQLKFEDHVLAWSRIDFLMSFGKEKFSAYMFEVKGRVDANWSPDTTDIVGASRDALQKVYGLSPLSFDDKWKTWVNKNYPVQ